MYNLLKYSCSILTTFISYFSKNYDFLFHYWIASAAISTTYSYYWDLKKDWGFLEKDSPHKFLRKHLCYENKNIYYFCFLNNLVLR
jgi:hypothetical protein